jgi:pyruvate dehydrogenase E2 component (dihydrolipoamide acetyltransferase)
MAEVRMPKMGDGMEEGTVLRWLKREGDPVTANESIAEIETDKANVEMPAEESGVLTKIVVQEGQTVPVGAVLAHIGSASSNGGGAPAPTESTTPVRADSSPSGEEGSLPPLSLDKPPAQSETRLTGPPSEERVKASPLARKLARERGIDLAQVKGTGPGGRIVERDVKEFQPGATPPKLPSLPETAPVARATTAAPTLQGRDLDITKMRKAIARRTVQSKQTIPHIYLTRPVEMERAMSLLEELNRPDPENKVTINDLIIKACAVALAKFPEVNVSYTPEDKLRQYETINVGFAVGTNEGLYIPVIPDCGNKSLRQISAEAKTLAGKARGGTISPQEMSGGTFSISNLGMFGIEEFGAVINPPESAILAVGAVMREAVVREDGAVHAGRRMRVTMSCDHRAVDGLLGARFLQELARLLETPAELLTWS